MHICLLTSARISDTTYGGEKRYTVSLGKWLASHDQNVTLIGSKFPIIECKYMNKLSAEQKAGDNRYTPRQLNKKSRPPPYIAYLLSRLWIALLWSTKILFIHNKNLSIELIHAQDTGYAALAALFCGMVLKIPVIVSSHGIRHKTLEPVIQGIFKKAYLRFNRRLDLFTIKHADRVLVTNSAVKNYYKQISGLKAIDVIPMAINFEHFEFSEFDRENVRSEMGIGKHNLVVGFVGRFSPEKNLLTLASVFAKIAKENSSIRLALVGSGQLEPQLREYAAMNRVQDRVIFYGVRDDMDRVLSSFDIFVLPSYTEGLSNALLEAMVSGRAIICSNIATNREIVTHNEEALLVDPHAPDELENAIKILSADQTLRTRIGHNAKVKSRLYDEAIVYPAVMQYYKNVVNDEL